MRRQRPAGRAPSWPAAHGERAPPLPSATGAGDGAGVAPRAMRLAAGAAAAPFCKCLDGVRRARAGRRHSTAPDQTISAARIRRRVEGFAQSLEQSSTAGQAAIESFGGEPQADAARSLSASEAAASGATFEARHPVGELEQILDDHPPDRRRNRASRTAPRPSPAHRRASSSRTGRARGAVGQAQHVAYLGGIDHAAAMGDRLVEHRQAVAHRAVGGAGQQGQRFGRNLDFLGRGDPPEMLDQRILRHALQVEALAALSTVTGTLRISVVANRNFTCGGGSSSVLSKALNALSDSMWTSSMM